MLVSLKGQLEADLTASSADILRAVSEAQAQAVAEASERAAAEVRDTADQQSLALRAEFERQRDELQSHAASEIAELHRAMEEVRAQLASADLEINDGRRERESLEHQISESRREALETERQLDEARQKVELIAGEVEQARGDLDASRRELEAARAALAQADRLAIGLKALDNSVTFGDVFDGLARSACEETSRVAIFLVRGDRLRGWRAIGFDPDMLVGADLQPDEAGVVGLAAVSGAGMEHRHGDGSSLPAFAESAGSRHALALPVEVGGSVIAVLYADVAQTDRPEEPRWTVILDVMARHAGRVLEAMTVRQAAALWTPGSAPQASRWDSRPVSGGGLQ